MDQSLINNAGIPNAKLNIDLHRIYLIAIILFLNKMLWQFQINIGNAILQQQTFSKAYIYIWIISQEKASFQISIGLMLKQDVTSKIREYNDRICYLEQDTQANQDDIDRLRTELTQFRREVNARVANIQDDIARLKKSMMGIDKQLRIPNSSQTIRKRGSKVEDQHHQKQLTDNFQRSEPKKVVSTSTKSQNQADQASYDPSSVSEERVVRVARSRSRDKYKESKSQEESQSQFSDEIKKVYKPRWSKAPIEDIKREVENIRNGTTTINAVVKNLKVSIRTVYRWLERY